MKLYDYIKQAEDWEITVFDRDYDIEVYFYKNDDEEMDSWDKSMEELSKLLTVDSISKYGVTVNLSEVIGKHIEALDKAKLFIECDIDLIMDDIEAIISGNVSEEWMEIFVNVLKYGYYFESVEMCHHCNTENVYPMWDVNKKGFVAVCGYCGKEIMLCDECIHAEDGLNAHSMGCDWCNTECGGKCFRGITKG